LSNEHFVIQGKPKTAYFGIYHVEATVQDTRNPAIAEGPRDAGVPVEIW